MSDYGVTKQGFNRKRYDAIYEEFQLAIKNGTGIDVATNPKSYINVLISSLSDKIAEMWETIEAVYFNMFPSTAEGINLDYACQFAGVTRKESTPTKYYIVCTGDDGTRISADEARIATSASPTIYMVPVNDGYIARDEFNKCLIGIPSPSEEETYTITLSDTEYAYTSLAKASIDLELEKAGLFTEDEIGIIHDYENGVLGMDYNDETNTYSMPPNYTEQYAAKLLIYYNVESSYYDEYETTLRRAILEGLLEKINEGESAKYITNIEDLNGTDVLSIASRDEYTNAAMNFSKNMTAESMSTVMQFKTEENGEYHLNAGAVDTIINEITGLKAVSNLPIAVYGSERETDEQLRQSYLAKQASRSTAMTASISAAILQNCEGVLTAVCFENDTDEVSPEGMPAHSIFVVVDGGEKTDIALQIYNYKPAGILTWRGANDDVAESVEVPTDYNSSITINFARPVEVFVWVEVTLFTDPNQTHPTNLAELTMQGVQDYVDTLDSGKSIYIQQMIPYINAKVAGVAYMNVKAAKSTDESDEPSENKYTDRYITVNLEEKAVFDVENRLTVKIESA
ncbi:MAG: hypothetical protein LUD47_07540 [Clostridia bacterium]|nr:hypothetical protein [Clostridia bacterium]